MKRNKTSYLISTETFDSDKGRGVLSCDDVVVAFFKSSSSSESKEFLGSSNLRCRSNASLKCTNIYNSREKTTTIIK